MTSCVATKFLCRDKDLITSAELCRDIAKLCRDRIQDESIKICCDIILWFFSISLSIIISFGATEFLTVHGSVVATCCLAPLRLNSVSRQTLKMSRHILFFDLCRWLDCLLQH